MIVTRDDFSPWRLRLIEQLQTLARLQIRVGVLGSSDGELLRIAYVQEFGMTIVPKRAKNLAIPLKPSMRGKSPRDVPNTWILESDGKRFIVRNQGKDGIEFLFLLLPRVTIPERSYIRAGYDGNKDLIAAACSQAVKAVISGQIDAVTAANHVGVASVNLIKRYMRSAGYRPKSAITLASAPGKTTPLIQTGRLLESITYEVIGT